jgi:HK97 gp10 family phage protein
MADTVSVKFDGLREVGDAMRSLTRDISQKIAYTSTLAAAKHVKEKAKQNLVRNGSILTEALYNGIVVKRLNKSSLTAEYAVTVSTAEMKKYVKKSRSKRHRQVTKIAPGKYKVETLNEDYLNLGDFFYSSFVEFGTVKNNAKPFLRPAFENNKEVAVNIIKDKLANAIAKATK